MSEEPEPRTTVCTESVSDSGLARLISWVPQSITVAAEDHRGTQAQAKQTKQVAKEGRKKEKSVAMVTQEQELK